MSSHLKISHTRIHLNKIEPDLSSFYLEETMVAILNTWSINNL
jgi:hypothetical protein